MSAIMLEPKGKIAQEILREGHDKGVSEGLVMNKVLINSVKLGESHVREDALARLLEVLEAGAPGCVHFHADNALESGVELSQLARLRAAHATYALATSTKMRRVGAGAWVRERYV